MGEDRSRRKIKGAVSYNSLDVIHRDPSTWRLRPPCSLSKCECRDRRKASAPRIAFLRRRKGHQLKRNQAELMKTLLPRLAIRILRAAPEDLTTMFPIPVNIVRFGSRFGGGQHLAAQAEAIHASASSDVSPSNGMAKALALIQAHELRISVCRFGDAADLFGSVLPGRSVAQVDLLLPRPWPKRRH